MWLLVVSSVTYVASSSEPGSLRGMSKEAAYLEAFNVIVHAPILTNQKN